MGLLSYGKPLPWEEAKKYVDHIRNHGTNQFLSIYHKMKNKQNYCLLQGDEVNLEIFVHFLYFN